MSRGRSIAVSIGTAALLTLATALPYAAHRIGQQQTIHREYVYAPGGRLGAICADGSRSFSTGRGTCSHHGGVARWIGSEVRTEILTPTFWARHQYGFGLMTGLMLLFVDLPAAVLLWVVWPDLRRRQTTGPIRKLTGSPGLPTTPPHRTPPDDRPQMPSPPEARQPVEQQLTFDDFPTPPSRRSRRRRRTYGHDVLREMAEALQPVVEAAAKEATHDSVLAPVAGTRFMINRPNSWTMSVWERDHGHVTACRNEAEAARTIAALMATNGETIASEVR